MILANTAHTMVFRLGLAVIIHKIVPSRSVTHCFFSMLYPQSKSKHDAKGSRIRWLGGQWLSDLKDPTAAHRCERPKASAACLAPANEIDTSHQMWWGVCAVMPRAYARKFNDIHRAPVHAASGWSCNYLRFYDAIHEFVQQCSAWLFKVKAHSLSGLFASIIFFFFFFFLGDRRMQWTRTRGRIPIYKRLPEELKMTNNSISEGLM